MAIFGDGKKADAQTIAQMTADITEGISASIAESISKAVGPVFERLAGEISRSLENTKQEQIRASEGLAKNVEALGKVVAELSEGSAQMKAAAARIAASVAEQKDISGKVRGPPNWNILLVWLRTSIAI